MLFKVFLFKSCIFDIFKQTAPANGFLILLLLFVGHGRLAVLGSTCRRTGVIGDGSAIRRRVDSSPAPSPRIFAFNPLFFAFQSLQQDLSQFTAGFSPIFCGRACVRIVIFIVLVYTVTLAAVIDELEGKSNFVGLETDNWRKNADAPVDHLGLVGLTGWMLRGSNEGRKKLKEE